MLIDAAQNSAFERKKKMSKFVVLTDSTCDLPDELAKQHDIDILCFKIALDGEGYTERVDFTPEQFCQMLRNATGLPTTAQITQFEFMERFEEYDRQGVEQALIAVQLMGVAYRIKMSRVEKRVVPAFDGRDEIVELEEEWA